MSMEQRLREALDGAGCGKTSYRPEKLWTVNESDLTRIAARLEQGEARLREALEPFAAVADEYDDSDDDHHEVWMDAGPQRLIRASFRLELYRRARQALGRPEQ
jgi:hypothetical protein